MEALLLAFAPQALNRSRVSAIFIFKNGDPTEAKATPLGLKA